MTEREWHRHQHEGKLFHVQRVMPSIIAVKYKGWEGSVREDFDDSRESVVWQYWLQGGRGRVEGGWRENLDALCDLLLQVEAKSIQAASEAEAARERAQAEQDSLDAFFDALPPSDEDD